MKVLIVEDNALTRMMLKSLLEQLKWEVAGEAEDGKEAIKVFSEVRPDAVFLDLILPGQSGLEALEEIRKLDSKVKIVIISAVEQDEISKRLADKGATAVLRKPFSFDEFKELLKRIE